MKCFHHVVDHFTRSAFYAPEINMHLFVCIGDFTLKFAHERCIMSSEFEGTPVPLKQGPNLINHHWKLHRPTEAWKYHSCSEHASFVGKGSVQQKFNILAHSTIIAIVPKQMTSGTILLHTLCLPQKFARVFSLLGVEVTPILATKITWWHINAGYIWFRLKL